MTALPAAGRSALVRRLLPGALCGIVALAVPTAAGDGESVAELELEGSRALFDYDFEDAERIYRRLTEAFPDHPAGPYNEAALLWTLVARRSGGMRGSTHQGDRYWTQTRKPEVAFEEDERFRGRLEEATARAEQALTRDPGDLEALYYLGATEALASGWEVVVRRSYVGGFLAIRRAVGRHRKILEADAGFVDAFVVPGAFAYGLATLPRALRVIAFLFGARGNAERGLEWVARTAREGVRARVGALWTLSVLLQREQRFEEAHEAVRALRAEFPKNPDYVLEEIGILLSRKQYAKARDEAEEFFRRRDTGFGNYRLAENGLAELRLGEALLFDEDWEAATEMFSRGLGEAPVSELRAMLHFRRGNARDGLGRRREALFDYLRVRQIGADEVLDDWAGDLRKTPWPDGAPEGSAPR